MRFYFDHNATTPLSDEAAAALMQAYRDFGGNASSIHQDGQHARQKLEEARRQIASFLDCAAEEVVFTSGGTESNNLALFGVLTAWQRAHAGERPHVITSALEHPAVLGPCGELELRSVDVTYIRPGADGRIDPQKIQAAIRPTTALISLMHVNNETGIVQPVEEVGELAVSREIAFHVDGVQAPGRVPICLRQMRVALYSLSGHKFYGPKGVGVLFVKKGVKLSPQTLGGRHERGRRAGTENVPGAAAIAVAAQWLKENGETEIARLAALRDHLESQILNRIPDCQVNGSGPRAANTVNVRVDGIEGEALVIAMDLRGFAISSGAACSSGAVEPSHVLLAMGLTREEGKSSIRISLGRSNTREQVDQLVEALVESVNHVRSMSPVYRPHAKSEKVRLWR
jgi:cysteine desulfurase